MSKKCQFIDKPCFDGWSPECQPYKFLPGKTCFPTADEYVAYYKENMPGFYAENQIRRWYANERQFQISMYPDKPLTEE